MNIQTTEILRIFWGFAWHILPIGGVIAERSILSRFACSSRRRLLNKLEQAETEIWF
jgi:hypothetical protein